ncbi:RNA polymerase sigma factor [Alicyclobacillus macrosporangiidus]|uniref:RNA polymerase sigma-70 factor, ECF subfamily n=1 Tax=Alicyclobacillus macrosporangiidus TaxID=392015 RepID=A0A1I7LB72_9BACL|nr:sigma-70 family RNA polymerase sigma factor [Alicyclobacillus macrosporangiidus]SFV06959.1 RNA polymerase sigma-70 factor, ECF subfamily [Alicyclobacillus macrosporangiidus]
MIDQWFDLYADEVYSFLAYMVRDRELARDLTQETFVHAMMGIHRFRAESSPKTWLLTIARNVAISHLRKRRVEVAAGDLVFDRLASTMGSPEVTVEQRDTQTLLIDALYQLRPGYRDVIICREIMGMSSKETARVLGWSTNKVRVTLHRALKAAKQQLLERGWGHELA